MNFVPDLAIITRVRIDVTKLLGKYATGRLINSADEPNFGWGTGTVLGTSASTLLFNEDRRVAQRFTTTTSAGRIVLNVDLSRDASSTTDGYVVCRIVDEVLLGAQQEGATFPAHDTKSNQQYNFLNYDIGGNQVGFSISQLPVGSAGGTNQTVACFFEFEVEGHLVPNKPYWFVLSTTSGGVAYVDYNTAVSNQSNYALTRDPTLGWVGIGTLFRDQLAGRFRLQRNLSSAGANGYGENLSLGLTAWDPLTGRAFPFTSTAGNTQKVATADIPTAIVARKDSRGHISVAIPCSAGAESSAPTIPIGFSRFDYSMKIDFKSGG